MATLRFVDSIASSPSTRLDLNDLTNWSMQPETRFPAPPMKRSLSGSLLADGEYVGESAYGNRELSLVLNVTSNTADTRATQLQNLIRELDRPANLLRYQAGGATHPVFFRTYRSSPENMRWEPSINEVRVSIPAEPFALGLRESAGPFTVNQNPAAGSNGCFFDVTGIKGDVEVPLLLTHGGMADPGSDGVFFAPGCVFGVRPGSSPYPTLFRQAESLTLLTDTTSTADATFSGGNKARISFSTNATLVNRIRGKFPTATLPAGAENRGRYRVWVRAKSSSMLTSYTLQINSEPTVTIDLNPYPTMLDLGMFEVHTNQPFAPGYDGSAFGASDLPELTLYAARNENADSLDIDYFMLVPADYRYGAWTSIAGNASTDLVVVDSPNQVVYSASTNLFTTNRLTRGMYAAMVGSFPYVKPGNNRVVLFQANGAGTETAVGTLIADTTTVNAYYWPRYVHLRPAST